jgi:hypothetical protein
VTQMGTVTASQRHQMTAAPAHTLIRIFFDEGACRELHPGAGRTMSVSEGPGRPLLPDRVPDGVAQADMLVRCLCSMKTSFRRTAHLHELLNVVGP